MAGLMAQHPNQDTTLAKPRAMQKPVIKEYDPHVGGNHSGRQWYTLVRLDEYGGVGHIASDDELRELEELILSEPDSSEDDGLETLTGTDAGEDSVGLTGSDFGDAVQAMSRQQVAAYQKPGGPCDHCGAIDSPQWRRGPASKPMLCNACGTRYRRTNNLGPPTPMARVAAAAVVGKKRVSPEPQSSLNPAKKIRCATDTVGSGIARYAPSVRA